MEQNKRIGLIILACGQYWKKIECGIFFMDKKFVSFLNIVAFALKSCLLSLLWKIFSWIFLNVWGAKNRLNSHNQLCLALLETPLVYIMTLIFESFPPPKKVGLQKYFIVWLSLKASLSTWLSLRCDFGRKRRNNCW